jgi:hypothetical protein
MYGKIHISQQWHQQIQQHVSKTNDGVINKTVIFIVNYTHE